MAGEDGSKNVFLPFNSRPMWASQSRDLKVDDVVLVIQPESPRGRGPLKRVTEVYPGRDGYTRGAKVVCGAKTV